MNTPQSDKFDHYNCPAIKIASMPGGGTTIGDVHTAIEDLLRSYAGAVDGVIGENESTDWEDSTDRQVAEECNQLRAEQRTALAKLRGEWGIGG